MNQKMLDLFESINNRDTRRIANHETNLGKIEFYDEPVNRLSLGLSNMEPDKFVEYGMAYQNVLTGDIQIIKGAKVGTNQ
jgi:hypothetical protein